MGCPPDSGNAPTGVLAGGPHSCSLGDMRRVFDSPWRAALLVLVLAILPVWAALAVYRGQAQRAESLLFERSAEVVCAHLRLLTSRQIGWQNALRMRLSNREAPPEELLEQMFGTSQQMEAPEDCVTLGYGALEGNQVILRWQHPGAALAVGADLSGFPETMELIRSARETPAKIVSVQNGKVLLTAMTVANNGPRDPRGWLIAWWDLSAMCSDPQLPLVSQDHALTVRPAGGNVLELERLLVIGEGDATWSAVVGKGAGFQTLFPRLSERVIVMTGGGCAVLLALLAGFVARASGLRAALDAERELLEMKDHLLHSVSHEFRTPLSVILSSTELLESYAERLSPERRAEALHQIRCSTTRMNDMVGQVLLLSRIEARRLPVEPRLVDVAIAAREVVRETEIALQSEGTIRLKLPETVEHTLDPQILRAILGNLLSNAVKFSKADGIVEFDVEPGERLRFRIRDHGHGIPQEELERVRDPFFRACSASDIPGNGLGLTIAFKCAELLGAVLTLESGTAGTTATLTLP